jgi:hypothetical protein
MFSRGAHMCDIADGDRVAKRKKWEIKIALLKFWLENSGGSSVARKIPLTIPARWLKKKKGRNFLFKIEDKRNTVHHSPRTEGQLQNLCLYHGILRAMSHL